jgi:cell division protein FtsL
VSDFDTPFVPSTSSGLWATLSDNYNLLMKKRLLILLIAAIVVLNISTDCGYERVPRSERNKKELFSEEVDSILIQKASDKEWRRLSKENETRFESVINGMTGSFKEDFKTTHEIRVFYKGRCTRIFEVCEKKVKEGRYYYYNYNIVSNYFDLLYEYSKKE